MRSPGLRPRLGEIGGFRFGSRWSFAPPEPGAGRPLAYGMMAPVNWTQIDPAWLLMNAAVLLFSLSLHESAHAWMADRLGDYTARYLGRVTLNPVVHVDPVGTLLFPLIGLLAGGIIFGWAKPVPVNTVHLANPKRDHVLIAAAGPASNVAAAVAFWLGLKVLTGFFAYQLLAQHPVILPLYLLFRIGVLINVVLAAFNLIPVPPLDGSWILSGLMPDYFSDWMDSIRPYGFLVLIVLLWTGFIGMILGPVLTIVHRLTL